MAQERISNEWIAAVMIARKKGMKLTDEPTGEVPTWAAALAANASLLTMCIGKFGHRFRRMCGQSLPFKRAWNRPSPAWQKVLGAKPDAARVAGHLAAIEKWRTHKPNTIRYMDRGQLESLRKEIIGALLTQGTTKERAEDLTASLVSAQGNAPDIEARKIAAPSTTINYKERLNIPYLDKGNLVIPSDCPERYRWWQGGQTIAETLTGRKAE